MKKRRKKHSFIRKYWSHSNLWTIVMGYFVIALLIITTFGLIYQNIENSIQFDSCKQIDLDLRSYNYYYFSSVTFYALGYGDICPATNPARLLSQIEVAIGAIINTLFIGFILWKVLGAHLK